MFCFLDILYSKEVKNNLCRQNILLSLSFNLSSMGRLCRKVMILVNMSNTNKTGKDNETDRLENHYYLQSSFRD